MKSKSLLTIAGGLSLVLGACSTATPISTGERISQRGSDIGTYGADWSKGQSNVAQGRKAIDKSSKRLADGEKELARARQRVAQAEQKISDATSARTSGERLVHDGTAEMQRAEADYAATKAGPSALPPRP